MGLFSSNKSIGKAKGSLGSLCSTLPDEERAAIVLLLMEIAQSNNVVNAAENKTIIAVLNFLSIANEQDANIEGQKKLKEITDKMEIHEAFEVLKTISALQKREVLVWLASMVNMDEPNQRSFQILDAVARTFNIDVNQFAQEEQGTILDFVKTLR